MPTPQPGIFALGSRSHYYLELDLRPGAEPEALARALVALREPKATTGGANIVVGFAADLWGRLVPDGVPADLRRFEPVEGPRFEAPSTQHDVWVWAHGASYDVVFDVARATQQALHATACLATEQSGFTYRASQDLTGFEDGTANPPIDEADVAAVVPDGEPGAGGSVVLVQRYAHDLGRFHAMEVGEQERVIGRTKADSVELEGDDLPADSHVGRVVIEDGEGEELEIFRRSASWGSIDRHGLVFVGFSRDVDRLDRMLRRMYGVDGPHDRLLEFTRPETGAYYFVPSLPSLRRFAD